MKIGATQLEHTGKPDCPACRRVEDLYARMGTEFAGLESREAAFLLALMVHTVHGMAPTPGSAAQFLIYVAEYLSLFQDFEDGDEKPTACH